jgi:hypothetical protein
VSDNEPPFRREDVLHGVAVLQAHLAEDTEAITALQGEGAEDPAMAEEAARGLHALAHVIVYSILVPQMWVVRNGVGFEDTRQVPELGLAVLAERGISHRIGLARDHPMVVALMAGDVMGLIIECTGTAYDDAPEFLDGIRRRTLDQIAWGKQDYQG